MYTKRPPNRSSIKSIMLDEGEPIEAKIRRIMKNGEPIKDKAPIVYTERKDGVMPEYDIRTDKWEIACDAKTRIADGYLRKREMEQEARKLAEEAKKGMKAEGETSVNDN